MAGPGDVLEVIGSAGVLPVAVIDRAADAGALADALVAGGLSCVEITLRSDAAIPAIDTLATRNDLLVGAGTVLDEDEVDRVVDAGARFVVSPGLDEAVVVRCRERGVAVLPGVVTATELQAARRLGLRTLKFFPAAAMGGLATLAALAGPFPDVRFVPTGGLGPEDVSVYLGHDHVLAVGGSWMVDRVLLERGDWGEVERRSRRVSVEARARRPDQDQGRSVAAP